MKNTKNIVLLTFGLVLLITSAAQAMSNSMSHKPVDVLISPYLKIQQGLAGDDLALAQAGADEFLGTLKNGDLGTVAKAESDELADSATSIAEASKIENAREDFQDLSLQMKVLIKRFGTSGDTPLYVAKCPMAFGGQGGVWIQGDKSIANPYFGSRMFKCGGIQEQIAGNEEASPSGHGEHKDMGHAHGAMLKSSSDLNVANLEAVHAGVPGYRSGAMQGSMASSGGEQSKDKDCGMSCCAKTN